MTGFVAAPVRCEQLREIVARSGGQLEITASERREIYALPEAATAEVREFFRRSTEALTGPDYVARLPGSRVYRSGIVISPDGTSIARDVSLDFGKSVNEHWLLGQKPLRAPEELGGATVVVASTLASGYAHWLLEELPRLLALDEHWKGGRLIAHATNEFSRTALARRGWRGTIVEPRDSTHVRCEELIVPSLIGSTEWPSARARRMLNEFVETFQSNGSRWGERLYISREGSRRRRVINEAALWAQLEPRGFDRLRLETLSWEDQVAAFRHAKIIVGPHGAGLANLVFCRPGTRVVELFQRSYVNGGYWRLATLGELDYRPVVTSGETALADGPAGNRLDLNVEIAAVLAQIDS